LIHREQNGDSYLYEGSWPVGHTYRVFLCFVFGFIPNVLLPAGKCVLLLLCSLHRTFTAKHVALVSFSELLIGHDLLYRLLYIAGSQRFYLLKMVLLFCDLPA